MKVRFSPKYFYLRTAVIGCTVATVFLLGVSGLLIDACIADESKDKEDTLWPTIGIVSLTLLFGFLTYVAAKSYDETFRKSDGIAWKKSKWKAIRRWLLEPYR